MKGRGCTLLRTTILMLVRRAADDEGGPLLRAGMAAMMRGALCWGAMRLRTLRELMPRVGFRRTTRPPLLFPPLPPPFCLGPFLAIGAGWLRFSVSLIARPALFLLKFSLALAGASLRTPPFFVFLMSPLSDFGSFLCCQEQSRRKSVQHYVIECTKVYISQLMSASS